MAMAILLVSSRRTALWSARGGPLNRRFPPGTAGSSHRPAPAQSRRDTTERMATEESDNAPARAPGPDPAPPPAPAGSAAGPAPRLGAAGALRVLRHREFAIFWVGQAISMVGTWMRIFAQQWVVTTLPLPDGAWAGQLCQLAAHPAPDAVRGVAADRAERRRILIYTQWAMLVFAVIMGALVQTGRPVSGTST